MRLLTVAFLLVLRSDTLGRAGIPVHHDSRPGVAAADHRALLASTVDPNQVDIAPLPLLASAASVGDGRAQSTPAPTRNSVSSCSYECTTSEAARPPPFQA